MKETPAAQEAFEDYYGMGPERSLPKLAQGYEEEKGRGEAVPTVSEKTLYEWSRKHNWQARIVARVEEDAEVVRKKLQERAIAFRERLAGAIEVDVSRRLERLNATEGTILAESAGDVEKLGKLYFQLTGQPLAEKLETTATGSIELFLREVLNGSGDGKPE